MNQFKFDGTGNADRVVPGSEFDSDFAAAIHLIGELRALKPDLYINLTTGTYPSPFWLRYADSIWRGGEDHRFPGRGSRSASSGSRIAMPSTLRHIVVSGPLYPLNSLMLHGMIYAKSRRGTWIPTHRAISRGRFTATGTGTQLQEMYITPSLLSSARLGRFGRRLPKWSRKNAAVLKDTHWIGGDPAKLEVYGWAHGSPRKGDIGFAQSFGQTADNQHRRWASVRVARELRRQLHIAQPVERRCRAVERSCNCRTTTLVFASTV